MIAAASTVSPPDWVLWIAYLSAFCAVVAVGLGLFDLIADRINAWLDRAEVRRNLELALLGRTADRDHIARWSAMREQITDEPAFTPDPGRLWAAPGTCEDGAHPGFVDGPDGIPICISCGSADVAPQTHPCRCGRGPVTALIAFEAVCATCAAETLRKLEIDDAIARHPSALPALARSRRDATEVMS